LKDRLTVPDSRRWEQSAGDKSEKENIGKRSGSGRKEDKRGRGRGKGRRREQGKRVLLSR